MNLNNPNFCTKNLCPDYGCCCQGEWHYCGCIDFCNCCPHGENELPTGNASTHSCCFDMNGLTLKTDAATGKTTCGPHCYWCCTCMENMDLSKPNWCTENICPTGCYCNGPWHQCGCIDFCGCCASGYNDLAHGKASVTDCFGCCGESLYPVNNDAGLAEEHYGCKCCFMGCGYQAANAAVSKSAAGVTVFLMMAARHVENNSLYQGLLALAFFMAVIAMVTFARRRPEAQIVGASMKVPLVVDEEQPAESTKVEQDSMA